MGLLRVLKPALLYFGIVFGVGFILGPIRVLLVVPSVGVRTAELLEAPIMLTAILIVGRWIGRSWCRGFPPFSKLVVGLITALLVLTADIVVGVGLREMTLVQVFTDRDPVAGSVYYGLIVFTAIAPWLLGRDSSQPQKVVAEPK